MAVLKENDLLSFQSGKCCWAKSHCGYVLGIRRLCSTSCVNFMSQHELSISLHNDLCICLSGSSFTQLTHTHTHTHAWALSLVCQGLSDSLRQKQKKPRQKTFMHSCQCLCLCAHACSYFSFLCVCLLHPNFWSPAECESLWLCCVEAHKLSVVFLSVRKTSNSASLLCVSLHKQSLLLISHLAHLDFLKCSLSLLKSNHFPLERSLFCDTEDKTAQIFL